MSIGNDCDLDIEFVLKEIEFMQIAEAAIKFNIQIKLENKFVNEQ
jgi:hypothetical protein